VLTCYIAIPARTTNRAELSRSRCGGGSAWSCKREMIEVYMDFGVSDGLFFASTFACGHLRIE
jgi:hypothetical protein